MKLDINYFNVMPREEFRVLTAVELGMKNHEWVPPRLIEKIAKLKRGNAYKCIVELLKHKLIEHTNQTYDGYRLNYSGYDYLAISAFKRAGLSLSVEAKIGVGKESDIYLVRTSEGKLLVLKLARLGRTSFKSVKNNRDYIQKRTQYNWLYLSRLASTKEFAAMTALYQHKFPVPVPVFHNRHAILMSFVNGFPLQRLKSLKDPATVYNSLVDLLERLASFGIVHGDFNEFNLMLDSEQKLTMIDFPQVVSIGDKNAEFYFMRDLRCVNTFFERKFAFISDRTVDFSSIKWVHRLDQEIKASGFDQNDQPLVS